MSNKPLVEMHRLVKILRLYITEYKAVLENSTRAETADIEAAKEKFPNRLNGCLESLDFINEELKYINEEITRIEMIKNISLN